MGLVYNLLATATNGLVVEVIRTGEQQHTE
jgi:hypothetical protein